MTTKEQERQAIEKIRKIVKELGENSYVGFAMEGVLELAEDNIREDTAYSMKKNAEIAWERADKAEKESKLLNAELGTAKKITEENNKAIAKLKADIYKLKANEVPEELMGKSRSGDRTGREGSSRKRNRAERLHGERISVQLCEALQCGRRYERERISR